MESDQATNERDEIVFNRAFSKMQSELRGAEKSSVNPHFKNKYADLEAVWEACREPLTNNGFSVSQTPVNQGDKWELKTEILHICGFSKIGYWPLFPLKPDMQGFSGAVTYARRGHLASMVGITQTDDDGNAACEYPSKNAQLNKQSEAEIDPNEIYEGKTPQQKAKLHKLMVLAEIPAEDMKGVADDCVGKSFLEIGRNFTKSQK